MWRGLRLKQSSNDTSSTRAELRGGLEDGWGKMYVRIMCLQDALYKAIKLSVSKTVHRRCNLCL